jgi:prepilin-type N-terminal cleavage/methylation domain-containing protein
MSLMNKKGFTLPELLIAAAIFAIAMAGILQMFISSAFLDQANRNKSIAVTHAEFVMEDIMEYMRSGSGDLALLRTRIDLKDWTWDNTTIGQKLGCAVYPCVLDSESITVNWRDRAQTNIRPLSLRTLISKR